jgi:hypothetical protein
MNVVVCKKDERKESSSSSESNKLLCRALILFFLTCLSPLHHTATSLSSGFNQGLGFFLCLIYLHFLFFFLDINNNLFFFYKLNNRLILFLFVLNCFFVKCLLDYFRYN